MYTRSTLGHRAEYVVRSYLNMKTALVCTDRHVPKYGGHIVDECARKESAAALEVLPAVRFLPGIDLGLAGWLARFFQLMMRIAPPLRKHALYEL